VWVRQAVQDAGIDVTDVKTMLPPVGHENYPYSVAEDAKRITLIQVTADAVVKRREERSAVLPLPLTRLAGKG